MDHLTFGPVKNSVDIALTPNRAIIRSKPVILPVPIIFAKDIVNTTPILLFLNTLIRTEPNKIKIIVLPVPSNECAKYSQKSLLFLIVLAPIP